MVRGLNTQGGISMEGYNKNITFSEIGSEKTIYGQL